MARRFSHVAFVASPAPEAQNALRSLQGRYPLRRSRRRGRHRGAGRRRPDAALAAPVHGHREADLRHEQGHGRLPHERVSRGRSFRPPGEALRSVVHPLLMVARDVARTIPHGPRHQRSVDAAPDLSGREAARQHRLAGAHEGAQRRRHSRWRRRPARPPTTSPSTAPFCRSMLRCWR